ncbi:MAG: CRISPR-associated endoribonuclease Cas6 [Bacillota bacterium]
MHIYARLKADNGIELPVSYNHIVQAALYKTIDPELADFLHMRGYETGKRSFKLFSFSRLSGRFTLNKEKGTFKFFDEINLVISSPVEDFCRSIANGLLTKDYITMGNYHIKVEKIVAKKFNIEKENVTLKTLSPIVAYSTLFKPDGRKYTCYFQPGEPDYNILITNNLVNKYQALYKKDPPQGKVRVLRRGNMRLHVVNYKNTVIKGYTGHVELTGPRELLQMAVDAGLGSKNSQGFGCVVLSGG